VKDLLQQINTWGDSTSPFAIATVIKTWGSSPRPVGSTMIIAENGQMAGSVSGGCIEGAVVKAAKDIVQSGQTKLLEFGVTDDDAWAVGLSCGGQITVFVERFLSFDPRPTEQQAWSALKECLEKNQSCVLISQLANRSGERVLTVPGTSGGHTLVMADGSTTGQSASDSLKTAALDAFARRRHEVFEQSANQFFLQVFPRRSQILIIGAAHITADLVDFAKTFDFETIVIDPRRAFASKTHFRTEPDIIIEKYPSEVIRDYTLDAYTYAVILSHDPKIDDNALHLLLNSDVAYIGALGSKKTHAKRVARLSDAGFTDTQIDRIYAPIGMNIHAKKPREIALSIIAQIISVQNGGK
jgi:xanthine dehydrogenase accessory factor